jgi:hypothetical protein
MFVDDYFHPVLLKTPGTQKILDRTLRRGFVHIHLDASASSAGKTNVFKYHVVNFLLCNIVIDIGASMGVRGSGRN